MLDAATLTKIENLRTISNNWSEKLEVYELLKLSWTTVSPVYYSVTETEALSASLPVSPVAAKIVSESYPDLFFPIVSDSSLADEEIDLVIEDFDGSFADLIYAEGEGIQAEVLMWFPAVELLLSVWQGHLRTSEDSDAYFWKGKIANGFRSPDLPLPRRAHWQKCQATFGGLLETAAAVAENDCLYDRHLGGSFGNLNGGSPYTSCPKNTIAECTARLNNGGLYHLSHQSQTIVVRNSQNKGPQLNSIARGNESNLKEPVRVVMGSRRVNDMEILAYRRDYNNRDADKGFFDALYEACEGPIQGFRFTTVGGIAVNAQRFSYRLGRLGEAPLSVALSTHGYSGTAYFRYIHGWVNPANISPDNFRGSAIVDGLNNIRVYTDATTYTEIFTRSRAWQIARMFCDKRWGFGLDYERLSIDSFIESNDWGEDYVRFTDPDSVTHDFYRSRSDVELTERTAQQQIEDMCSSGRFSRPFFFQGEIHIKPIRALTSAELLDVPVFTDEGTDRNIIVEEGSEGGGERSTLRRSQESDLDIPNRIECTFHDNEQNTQEVTADPAEDEVQQLKAGKVLGDISRRIVTKKYSLLGVTQKEQAVALSYWLLYFGEFNEGGLLNNLEITFKIWFLDALDLHAFKVIKVESAQLERFGFDYFQIKNINRSGDLHVEITAQAFNQTALEDFDEIISEPGGGGGGGGGPVCRLKVSTAALENNLLDISIEPC